MTFIEKITGSDIKKEFKCFEARVKKLPVDYQDMWKQIEENLWQYSNFTGCNMIQIIDITLDILEELAINGKSAKDTLGDDIEGFCSVLVGTEGSNTFRDKWRKQLNNNIAKKIDKHNKKIGIQNIIEAKKEWRAHIARVKEFPKDYQIVYKEIQKYIFKVSPGGLTEGVDLLSGIVDFFEESVSLGKSVLEVTGNDVAYFCDELIKSSISYVDIYQESVDIEINKRIKDNINKTKQ